MRFVVSDVLLVSLLYVVCWKFVVGFGVIVLADATIPSDSSVAILNSQFSLNFKMMHSKCHIYHAHMQSLGNALDAIMIENCPHTSSLSTLTFSLVVYQNET